MMIVIMMMPLLRCKNETNKQTKLHTVTHWGHGDTPYRKKLGKAKFEAPLLAQDRIGWITFCLWLMLLLGAQMTDGDESNTRNALLTANVVELSRTKPLSHLVATRPRASKPTYRAVFGCVSQSSARLLTIWLRDSFPCSAIINVDDTFWQEKKTRRNFIVKKLYNLKICFGLEMWYFPFYSNLA